MDVFNKNVGFTKKEVEKMIDMLKSENEDVEFRIEGDGYQVGSLIIVYDDKRTIAVYQRDVDGLYHSFREEEYQ